MFKKNTYAKSFLSFHRVVTDYKISEVPAASRISSAGKAGADVEVLKIEWERERNHVLCFDEIETTGAT